VGQTADILAFRAHAVPVGEDQIPHIELTREVARRFNQLYCGVDPKTEDADHAAAGGVFPIPEADVGKVARLPGTDGVNKMSKSLGNAIFLTDELKQIQKKLGKLYTGRQSPDEPGDIENALFQYVRTFISDADRVAELERRYAAGDDIGDGHIKIEVAEAIDALIAPMRERRAAWDDRDDDLIEILREGSRRANAVAEETLSMAKEAAGLGFWKRSLSLD
jgi:tryptophanyl-tRNA synthetase